MAGKKKQPPQGQPKPPQGQPAVPPQAKPAVPPAPPARTATPAAAPAPPSAPVQAAAPRPAVRSANVDPGPARDNHGAKTKPVAGGARLPGLPPQVPLLGVDWDEASINIHRLPYWTMPIIYALIIVSFIFLAMTYVARNTTHANVNRISIVPDMDNEPRWKSQQANYMFKDHRASRAWPDGTVPRGQLNTDDLYDRGIINGQWATGLPPQITVNQALLDRGKSRFNIYCSPCHGTDGYGNGMVAKHADLLKEGTWTTPLNYHTDQVRNRPVGHLFNTITNGIRTMPPYGSQIPVADRWAIVAWIRVLQASQNVDVAGLPAQEQQELLQRKPAVVAPPAAPAAATPPASAAAPAGSNAPAGQPAAGTGAGGTTPPAASGSTTPPAGGTTGGGAAPPAAPAAPAQGSTK